MRLFTGEVNEKGHQRLTNAYYFDGKSIRRRIQKIKGKGNKKRAKYQRIWDRTYPAKEKNNE